MNYQTIRQEIVDYAKRMYDEKLVSATSGNISVRLPDRADAFAITPGSESYLRMTADRIVIMTIDGELLSCPEGARPSSEWRLHAELYRMKEKVTAVVHTHSPYATAFASIREEIPLVLAEMQPWLGGSVEVAPYAALGTVEVAQNSANTIGTKGACLMANHGVVAVANSLDLAYVRACYVEDAAKIIHLARCIGTPCEIAMR